MSEIKNNLQPPDGKKFAMVKYDLSELQPDYVRVVHLCHPNNIDYILENGLDYSKYGSAMSTARAWQNPEEVEFGSDDPRFSSPELKCVVFDMPSPQWNQHVKMNNRTPGLIPISRLVGIIPANQSKL